MKIHTGFVSNSSSTSFVCDISLEGGEYSSEDWPYPVFECVQGHVFSSTYVSDNNDGYNFVGLSDRLHLDQSDDLERFLDWNNLPSSVCPICEMQEFAVMDLLHVLLKDGGFSNRGEFEDSLRSRFGNYEAIRKYILEGNHP